MVSHIRTTLAPAISPMFHCRLGAFAHLALTRTVKLKTVQEKRLKHRQSLHFPAIHAIRKFNIMTEYNSMPIDILRELIRYNAETGELFWNKRSEDYFNSERAAKAWNARYADQPALITPDKDGYFEGGILGKRFRAHRVAWALHYGSWPVDQLGPENGVKSNKAIRNLQGGSNLEKSKNQTIARNNTSGVCGVYWCKKANKWKSSIIINGTNMYLGSFAQKMDAVAVRKSAEAHYGFNRKPKTSQEAAAG